MILSEQGVDLQNNWFLAGDVSGIEAGVFQKASQYIWTGVELEMTDHASSTTELNRSLLSRGNQTNSYVKLKHGIRFGHQLYASLMQGCEASPF
jgi:hypothetical protein